MQSYRPQYNATATNSLESDHSRQQAETARQQQAEARQREEASERNAALKAAQAKKSQEIADQKQAEAKLAQEQHLAALEEQARRQREAMESAKRFDQVSEQKRQYETDAATAAQHLQNAQKNEQDARKKPDDHLERIKSATPAEKPGLETELKRLKEQHETAQEAHKVAQMQTDAAQVKAKLSADAAKKSAAEHAKATGAAMNAARDQDRARKKADDAVHDHATASDLAASDRAKAKAAQNHLDNATKVRKEADAKASLSRLKALGAVTSNHDPSRQKNPLSTESGPVTDFATFAHLKAIQAKSLPQTKTAATTVHPILSDPAWPHDKQHMQQQVSQVKWPVHVPGKTEFESAQKNAIAKLNAVDKASVNAGIVHNRAKVFATLKPVAHKSNPGQVNLVRHKVRLSPHPGKAQSGKALTAINSSGNHPLASLGAANASSFATGNPSLGGVIAGLVIGTIGQAMLLGPGVFGPGGLSAASGYNGSGGAGADDNSSLFNSGCTYVPNADDSQVDPNSDGSGVVMSVNSDPSSDDSVSNADPQQGAVFDQQISSAPDGNNSDVSQTVIDDGSSVPIDSVPQSGRYLNVVNLSQSRATFHIKYHAIDQNGNWNWFPSAPDAGDDALIFDLEPGQAVELWDGDWHVYADKARIWASSADGQHQWGRYQNSDLLLVSEQDDQGQPSYLSPDIQTLSFGLK